ncbi:MAG: hypothetical protein MR660_01395 [Peptoniphilaceae bacterium]|nr:hypothetical protein [Peptoniphilaceae bacterium]
MAKDREAVIETMIGDTMYIIENTVSDDELQGDSNSILNQKAILQKYADDNGFTNTQCFVDDGYSGTSFAGVR